MNIKKPSAPLGSIKEVSKNPNKGVKPADPVAQPSMESSTELFSPHSFASGPKKKGPITRVTVKYDVGFSNALYLRGKGANLNWDRGVMLKNVKSNEWLWETDVPFSSCEFKVLINDRQYEVGENHPLTCGTSIQYTPRF
jgi:hypothetical protein